MLRRRGEDGAVAILVALVICFLLVPLAAIAVDLGMQRVARRDMQSLSDVVALDLSRDVDGSRSADEILAAWNCPVAPTPAGNCEGAFDGAGNPVDRVARSVDRNKTTLGDGRTVVAQLGCVHEDTGEFRRVGLTDATDTIDAGCTRPDAVEVASETSVDFNLADGRGGAHRTAVGTSVQSACYYLGSFAARLSSADSELLDDFDRLLGLNLDAVSYQGLADADLSLADLAANSNIGSVDQLLGGGLTLGDLLAASYEVLNGQGEPENAVALSLLNNPSWILGASLDTVIDLGDILGVSTADEAALQADMNLLDLLAGAVMVANGENFLTVQDLGIAAGILTVQEVKVIQGKRFACGRVNDPDPARGRAEADQVSVRLAGDLDNLRDLIPNTLGVNSVDGGFTVEATVGSADGLLVGDETINGVDFPSVHCGAGSAADPDKYNVRVSNGLASASVGLNLVLSGNTSNVNSIVSAPVLSNLLSSLLGGLVTTVVPVQVTFNLSLGFSASTAPPAPSGTAHLQVPANSLNNDKAEPPLPDGTPVTVGNDQPLQLPALPAAPTIQGTVTVKVNKLGLLGGLLGTNDISVAVNATSLQPLLTGVQTALNNSPVPAVTSAVNGLLGDAHDALGLTLGGSDVFGHFRPECRGAQLVR